MRKLLFIALLLPCSVHAQILGGNSSVGGGGSNIYTFVQLVNTNCVTPCSVTVASTGTGHLLYVQGAAFNGSTPDYITAVSGACGSWVIPVAAQITSNGSVSSAYCLSSTSGVTSITVTTSTNSHVRIWEYSSTSAPAFDVCGTVNNAGSSTSQPGVALTLSSPIETVIQEGVATLTNITAVSAPYGNFNNAGLGSIATADSQNTSSGVAPTWTLAVADPAIGNACAFK